jgi:hypothetical protein
MFDLTPDLSRIFQNAPHEGQLFQSRRYCNIRFDLSA